MVTFLLSALLIAGVPTALAAADFISGKVMNADGSPEAGVWVIAETEDLPTEYRKLVVSDADGRFLLPEMPSAEYKIWVRGYGLADSERIKARVGDEISLTVHPAENARQAAHIYPASYWLSMLEAPPVNELRKAEYAYSSQPAWLSQFNLNCNLCHQTGSAATRFPVQSLYDYGLKKAGAMNDIAQELNRELLLDVLDSFAKKIAAEETPSEAPPRPQGIERNFVITQWAWGERYTYAHDEIATDKRNPYLYPNQPVYGVDIGNDHLLILDPIKHTADKVKLPAGKNAKRWCENTYKPLGSHQVLPFNAKMLGCPEPGVVTPHIPGYVNPVNPHNPMLDDSGKVWMTMQIRREWGEDLPEFCTRSPVIANNPHHRQLGYYDTKTGEIVPVDTCYSTHHLQFDTNGVLWTSGDTHVIGWLDTKKFSPDDPETLEAAMGWSEGKIDTDGDGTGEKTVVGFRYGVIPNPADGSVWMAMPAGMLSSTPGEPGYILRYDPATDNHEAYTPPVPGLGPRGIDVDTKGIVWTALGGSGHLARFDRSRCKRTWGPGDQCPEGWTLWKTPGPQFKSVQAIDGGGSIDMHYYLWVDQFDTLGMGRDTVIVNGTVSDSLIAFNQETKTFTVIRIPYPLNTFTRGLDGRIDDPDAGWKGRGVWFTNGLDPVVHSEIPKSYVGKVQLRPNPLAH
jgi:streptogramin lyase